jgi:formylglycine-generating enzyme required for sulfatase activity
MDRTKALQNLLKGKATKKEIELLKQALASGEISIGGDVKHSIVITGDGNNISLTPEALNLLKPETTSEEPVAGEPPYMGLRYFDTSDAELFYGREALTRELFARVQKESFLAIVGASGSGKSSVARAGLIHAWRKENERGAVHVITPTAHPFESLAASLTRESESVTATSTLMDDLKNDSRSLRLYVKKTLGETKSLLLVDQFEETFTLCKDADERKAFIENLLSLADDGSFACVVITLRADFYHHCAEYEGLRQALKKHQEYIGAMTADELRQAITTPAEKNSWKFQDGLVEQILQDVGTEPGALPLLSHALLETWKRRQGHTLTLQGYHAAGGVKKAIAQTAESVYDKLTPAEQAIARGIFLRLTELGEGTQDTRRRVKLDELAQSKEQDSVAKVLKTLTDARLVTTEQDSAEVAHEALIREWGTLRKWLDEDRESLRLHRHLTESAQEWKRRGKEASELYRGVRLRQTQEWMKDHNELLSPLEKEFLGASRNIRKQERLQWISIIGVGIALLIMVILGITGQFNSVIYQPVDMENYWVTIPAGEFQMGSDPQTALASCQKYRENCKLSDYENEAPVHSVYVDAFMIGRYEITSLQYNQCVRAGVCIGGSGFGEDRDFHPVVNVTWQNALTYCTWVNGRLPTEAEWEKAARGGLVGKSYPWGDEPPTCTEGASNGANFDDGKVCPRTTMRVGSFSPNNYELYDMAGNVWEWVNSSQKPYPYDASDGREDVNSSSHRVLRGGSWDLGSDADIIRSSFRSSLSSNVTYHFVGFRCARDMQQSNESILTATAFAPSFSLTATAYAPTAYAQRTANAQTATASIPTATPTPISSPIP